MTNEGTESGREPDDITREDIEKAMREFKGEIKRLEIDKENPGRNRRIQSLHPFRARFTDKPQPLSENEEFQES